MLSALRVGKRMNVGRTVVGVAVSFFATVSSAQGTWRPVQTVPGSFGFLLEPVFSRSLQHCGAKEIDETGWVDKLFGKPKRSAIPIEIQDALQDQDLLRSAYEIPGTATLKLWMYTFDQDTLSLKKLDGMNNDRLLDIGAFGPLGLPSPDRLEIHVEQLQTCSSVIAAAAKAGLKPPAASMSAALKADYTRKETFAFVRGSFLSPLAQLLGGTSLRDQRLGLLTIYQLYLRDPQATTRQRYYLSQFEGASLIKLGGVDQSRAVSASAEATGNFLFATADGSIKYGSTYTTKTTAADYSTYVFSTPQPSKQCNSREGCVHFIKLPSPSEINSILAGAPIAIEPSPAPTFSRSAIVPIHVQQKVGGIPKSMCGSGLWAVANAQPAGTVLMVGQDTIQGQPGDCTFSFVITPNSISGNDVLPIAFELALNTSASLAPRIKFAATLTPTDDPRLQVLDFAKVASVESNQAAGGPPVGHSWTVKMTFYDAAAHVDLAQPIQILNPSLSCDGSPNVITAGPALVDQTARTYSVKFSRSMAVQEEVKEGNHFTACTLAAELGVPLAAGGRASRQLTTQVLLTVIAPKAPTPVQPPATVPRS